MFGFIEKMFIAALTFVGCGVLKCVSISDQECKVRAAIVNVTSIEPLFYPCIILVNKCGGRCNDINSPHVKLYFPDVVNIKVFNPISKTNETHYLGMWLVHIFADLIQVFGTTNNIGTVINTGVNIKNWLIKANVIMDLFGILLYVSVSVTNWVKLENI